MRIHLKLLVPVLAVNMNLGLKDELDHCWLKAPSLALISAKFNRLSWRWKRDPSPAQASAVFPALLQLLPIHPHPLPPLILSSQYKRNLFIFLDHPDLLLAHSAACHHRGILGRAIRHESSLAA